MSYYHAFIAETNKVLSKMVMLCGRRRIMNRSVEVSSISEGNEPKGSKKVSTEN